MPRDYEAEELSFNLRRAAARVLRDSEKSAETNQLLENARSRLWRSKQALERTECRTGPDFQRYCNGVAADIQVVRDILTGPVKVRGRHRAYDDRSWVRKIYERYTR